MANVLSLRDIERQVSGHYNVGSLRLNKDHELEHVNGHVFKANNDLVTKEQNRAVRKAISLGFQTGYAAAAKVDSEHLGVALRIVQKDLKKCEDTELSRDEVRAMLKGLHQISKGHYGAGKKWLATAKVIRALKAGRVVVDENYHLVAKDVKKGDPALDYYRDKWGVGTDKVVKLNSDFLRGCKWLGTAKRWDRTIKSGTPATEIVATDTPEKIGTWLKNRLAFDGKKVSFVTNVWGPRTCEMVNGMTGLVQKKFDKWCEENDNVSEGRKLKEVKSIIDTCCNALFVKSTLARDFFRTEHSLSPFPEHEHKNHLKDVLLNGYNRGSDSGNFPGLYKDFIRSCTFNINGWLTVNAQIPKECPYEFPKSTDAGNKCDIKAGKKSGSVSILAANVDLIKKLCQIKNEKVRKMVSYTFSHAFAADLFGRIEADGKKYKIVGGKPFAAYNKVDGSAMIVAGTGVAKARDDVFGKVNVTVNTEKNKVEMTIQKPVAPLLYDPALSGSVPELMDYPLKDGVCVEYKVTISPVNGDGEPNVTVTSARLMPNVKELKPDVVKG